ncbi:hypothetical protein JTB14_000784 [Gonioctena quinquepunctata]|nr:hypothetical protein JTB14_000784 [Gonioctena quinquepunctata]
MISQIVKFFIFSCPLVLGYKFPEAFKKCNLNDPQLDSCLNSNIENTYKIIGESGMCMRSLKSDALPSLLFSDYYKRVEVLLLYWKTMNP